MKCWHHYVVATIFTLCASQPLRSEDAKATEKEAATKISYYRDIRPIFQANCHGCHQPAKQAGEYVMTDPARLLKGGESGEAAIVPGQPEKSQLLTQIRVQNGEAAMPKGQKPLDESHIKSIEQWIAAGAVDDSPASAKPQYDAEHPPTYLAAPFITSLDFSPDGKLLAVSGYHEVILHQADGSGMAGRLVGLSERIESAVFSPDGKRLAVTGGSPGRMGEVQVWDVENKKLVLSKTVGYDTIYGASWSHDGKYVAFGCPDKTTRAIESDTGKQVFFTGAHEDWVLDTVFAVKSDHVVTVSRDMSMKLMHFATQRFIDNITSITPGALKGGLAAVERHPTKDEVLVGGADGTPKIYRLYREKARVIGDDFNLIRAFAQMPGRLFDVAYSQDGQRVLAGSSLNGAGEIRIFQEADGKELVKVEIPDGGVYDVAFHPDGKTVAAGGFEGKVWLIDAATGSVLKKFYPVQLDGTPVAAANQ
jgi:WD40 repeat protein/mono/diheme cytochrome c family protein